MQLTRYLGDSPKNFKIVGYFMMKSLKNKMFFSAFSMVVHSKDFLKELSLLPKLTFSNRYLNTFPASYVIVGIGKQRYEPNKVVPKMAMKLSKNDRSLDFLNFMDTKLQSHIC